MIIALLGLLLAAAPAGARTDSSAPIADVTQTPAAKRQALLLAKQLYPEEQQVRVGVRATTDAFLSVFRNDPKLQKMEKEFPGITQATVSDLEPTIERFIRSELPNYIEAVANLYAQRFTANELVEVSAFFQTPTGKKLASGVIENVRLDAVMQEFTADPDKPASYDAIAADHKAAVDRVKMTMDASDKAALGVLVGQPWFVKMAAVGPAMRKLDQDFSNQPAPAFEAEVAAVVEASMTKFIAQANARSESN